MRQCGGVVFSVFVLLAVSCTGSKLSYAGYNVYQVKIHNMEDIMVISKMRGQAVDFWTELSLSNQTVNLMVSPWYQEKLLKFLNYYNLEYTLMIEDVGRYVHEMNLLKKNRKSNEVLSLPSTYASYDEIISYLGQLSNHTNPENGEQLIILEEIGLSSENKSVVMAKISSDHAKEKPIILLEAGMHAREWAAEPTVLYLAQQLTENYTSNMDWLEDVDIYIIPVANPDGYEYSRNFDRMWRKTRTNQGVCVGVDGNRNFDHCWGGSGASEDPCSEIFRGSEPFSEKETQNIRDVAMKYRSRILSYVSVHSYGSYLLYPWGYTQDLPEDWETLDECAKSFADSVEQYSGTKYTYGSSARVLYEASGGSDDWFKGALGIPFSYTLELPGSEEEGFELPTMKLPDVQEETFAGWKSMFACFLKFHNNGKNA